MDTPRDLVLGTAGHIDHGKTALVRALTGVDTDRLPAEKQRGITIDIGFASLEFEANRLSIVDVPGHERFIRNMLAGATGLDLALLVVAADDSVMPQTREHLEILRLLGLNGGAIALTKCDLAESGWLDLVEEEVRGLVAGTFLENAPIVRTSAAKGRGIEDLRGTLRLLAEHVAARDDPGVFRLAIDRSFTVAGHGTVVTGTVASGSIAVGDELQWWPSGRSVRVRGLQRHDRPVDRIARGARGDQRGGRPSRGSPSRRRVGRARLPATDPRPHRRTSSRRRRAEAAPASRPLSNSLGNQGGLRDLGAVRTRRNSARPRDSWAVVPCRTGRRGRRRAVDRPRGESAGDGRRRSGLWDRPCAGCVVATERPWNGSTASSNDPAARLGAALASFGLASWTDRDLCRETGLTIGEAAHWVDRLTESGRLVELPLGPRRTVRVFAETVAELEDRALRALGRLHAAKPRLSAIRREHLAAELQDLDNDALVSGLVERLKTSNKVLADARTVALKGYEPKLSQGERRLKNEIAEAIRAGGVTPPDLADMNGLAGQRANVLSDLLGLLVDEERIVRRRPQHLS